MNLGNLVPCLTWSFSSCCTISLETYLLSNLVLLIQPFYMTKPPKATLPHDNRNFLDAQPICYISSEYLRSERRILHIHLVSCISIHWSLQMSSVFIGHVSLPYNIALLIPPLQIFPLSLYENTLGVRSSTNYLDFFHPVLTRVIELAPAPPLAVSISPRQQN